MNTSSYDIMLSLPLFSGMDKNELLNIAAHNRLDFRKYLQGDKIVWRGERCVELFFVIFGDIKIRKYSSAEEYSIEEDIHSPWLIQPDRLYGLQQSFTEDVFAITDCNVLSIDKKTVSKIYDLSLAFKFNFLNCISTHQQHYEDEIWKESPITVEKLIKNFFVIHSTFQAYSTIFHITMKTLANEINANRLEVSKSLNEMQMRNIVKLNRSCITFNVKELL